MAIAKTTTSSSKSPSVDLDPVALAEQRAREQGRLLEDAKAREAATSAARVASETALSTAEQAARDTKSASAAKRADAALTAAWAHAEATAEHARTDVSAAKAAHEKAKADLATCEANHSQAVDHAARVRGQADQSSGHFETEAAATFAAMVSHVRALINLAKSSRQSLADANAAAVACGLPPRDGSAQGGALLAALLENGGRVLDGQIHQARWINHPVDPAVSRTDLTGIVHAKAIVDYVFAAISLGYAKPNLPPSSMLKAAEAFGKSRTNGEAVANLERLNDAEGEAISRQNAQAHAERLARVATSKVIPAAPGKPKSNREINAANVRRFAPERRPPPLPDDGPRLLDGEFLLDSPSGGPPLKGVG